MYELRCIFCNRYLLSYEFKGEINIIIKCKGCLKTNVFYLAKTTITSTNLSF
jgi:phage FluMu protein Com